MKTRVIQIVWGALTLVSLWVFGNVLSWLVRYFQNPSTRLTSALAEAGISIGAFAALNILFALIIYLSFFVVAQLIMLRRSQENFSLLAAIVLLAFGTGNAAPAVPELYQFYFNMPPAIGIPFGLLNFLGWTLIGVFMISYPDGKFIPHWTPWLAGMAFVLSAFWTTNPETFSRVQGIEAILLLVTAVFGYGGILYAQIWRYRHYYSPLQKQQVKWFVLGVIGILVTVLPTVIILPAVLDPQVPPQELLHGELIYLLFGCGYVLLPLSIGTAILRYRLWDIDIIIRRTLIYSIITAILAFFYFGSVIVLQQFFRSLTGAGDDLAIIVSTLAIAALFTPLRRRVQNAIDHRFYRRKYDAQIVLERFAATARDEVELEKLTGELINVVNETMQPTTASLWLKKTDNERRRTEE